MSIPSVVGRIVMTADGESPKPVVAGGRGIRMTADGTVGTVTVKKLMPGGSKVGFVETTFDIAVVQAQYIWAEAGSKWVMELAGFTGNQVVLDPA